MIAIIEKLRGCELSRRLRLLFSKTARMRNKRPIISFTFDDFPHSAVLNGAMILEKYGACGTFYVTGSYCGQVVDGVVQYHAEDLSALVGAGHEIGCHTFHHQRVSLLTANRLNEDISFNKAFVARHLPNVVMRTFAYPFGDMSFLATLKLQRMFSACRSTQYGLNTGAADLGRLRAVRLYDRVINVDEVSALIQQAVATNAWLIFYTHDVDVAPSQFGCTLNLFERAVKVAVSSGAEVLPMEAATRKILAE
jgi:peptidoglycan/xylan/chitin deacetylase (PgdA/CDA1 family)